MDNNKKIAVIGCGVWGKNIVRNFYNLNALHTVCDLDSDNLQKIKEQYSGVNLTQNFNEIIENPEIKGVCVVTPSHTHFGLVVKALEKGKNVYVEKPISTVADEAFKLSRLAKEKGLILMVGHLLLYHPAVNRLKMLIAEGALGKIKYAQSDRLNINYFRNDRSVMWDLAPHDVSMISYVLGEEPIRVLNATGCATADENIFDITHITLEYPNGIVGHISDSWIHPQKRVSLLVRGEIATAILDDTLAENKLQIYNNKLPANKTVETFDYLEIEPLKLECQHFLNCIDKGLTPRSDGENGLMTVKMLEQAEDMLLGENKEKLNKVDFALSRLKK